MTPDLNALKWEINYHGRRIQQPPNNWLAAALLAMLIGTLAGLVIRWLI